MKNIKFFKGTKDKLPSELNEDYFYLSLPNDSNEYGSIYVGGKEWTSKEYVDDKIGTIELLLDKIIGI